MTRKSFSIILITLCLIILPATSVIAIRHHQPVDSLILDGSVDPQNIPLDAVVHVDLSIIGNLAACDPNETRVPLDIVLVIDRSGSMDDELGSGFDGSKLEGALAAVEAFLEHVEPSQDRVALVAFSDTGKTYAELGDSLSVLSQFDEVRAGNGLGSGQTNIEAGLTSAAELLQNPREEAFPVVVLLTDGMENEGNAGREAKKLKDDEVRLVSIGLGPQVDEVFLMNLASEPEDYYFAPDTASLKDIFDSIALDIQAYSPASDITVRFTFDMLYFDLVEESISPEPHDVSVDVITWQFAEMQDLEKTLSLDLVAKAPGVYDSALTAELSYVSCGTGVEKSQLNANLPVTVTNETPQPPDCQAVDSGGFMSFICGFKIWGLLGGLLAALGLLLLWYLRYRQNFKAWRCCGIKPPACVWAKLPLILWAAIFLGALLGALNQHACAPKQGMLFWRILPDRSSAIYLKSDVPDLSAQPLTDIYPEQEWMGFYAATQPGQRMAAVSRGTNGLIVGFDLNGDQIAFPQIQGAYPAWSPDGTKLAYAANNEDIYILDLQTGATQPLAGASDPNVVETMPAWNADGTIIAFVRASAGGLVNDLITTPTDIMFVSSSGGTPLLLPGASGEGFNYYPAYSPDGKWLAFTHHMTGKNASWVPEAEVRIIPAEGGAPRKIQANYGAGGQAISGAGNIWPTWSMDGKTLYFSSRRCNDQYDIYSTLIDDQGNSGSARRETGLSDPVSFEYKATPIQIAYQPLIARLLSLWPLLLPLPFLLLILYLFCREKPAEKREDTLDVAISVEPKSGANLPSQKFKVAIEVLGKPVCEKKTLHKDTDAVILLDASSSMATSDMNGQSRLAAAKEAAKRFVRCVLSGDDKERIAVIGFSDDAKVYTGLTDDEETLLKAIDDIDMGVTTNMTEGLSKAKTLLENSARKNIVKTIILLSDGAPNNERTVLTTAEALKDADVRILSIGVGDAPKELLRTISPDNDYKFVMDRQGLYETFIDFGKILITPVPAKEVTIRHAVDAEKFKIIPESIFPMPVDFSDQMIVWKIPSVTTKPLYFSYTVKPRSAGEHYIDTGTDLTYFRCEASDPRTFQVPAGARVLVDEVALPIIIKPKAPREAMHVRRPDIVWQPDHALFIGVGHYGRKILSYIRKNLLDSGVGELPEGCEFLVFDTGGYEDLTGLGDPLTFAGVETPDKDVFMVDENLTRLISRWRENPEKMPDYMKGWFDPSVWMGRGQELNLATGRYSHRALTRAAILRHVMHEPDIASLWLGNQDHRNTDIHQWIRSRCEAARKENGDLRIFVIGSVSDGMGGTLLDLTLLTRQIAEEDVISPANDVHIEAYLLDAASVEATLDDNRIKELYNANAFASIREINRWQLNLGHPLMLPWMSNPTTRSPFDELYIYAKGKHDDLFVEAFPVIADLVTSRLDRATGAGSEGDWFNDMHQVRSERKREHHLNVVGTANTYSLRVPINDILESINARWSYSLVRHFFVGPDENEIIFDESLAGDPGLPADPKYLVSVFLLGWCEFGGAASLESMKMARLDSDVEFSLSDDESDLLQNSTAGLSDQQIEQLFQARLTDAISHILNGTSDYRLGSRAGKLAYLQSFLKALDEKLSSVRHLDGEEDLKRVAKIYQQVLKKYLESVEKIKNALYEKRPDKPLGFLQELQQYSSAIRNIRQELERVVSRRYFWGSDPDHDFADSWYGQYLSKKEEDYMDMLWWSVDENGIDLRLMLQDQDVRLLKDGKASFIKALLFFAMALSKDAWDHVNMTDILKSHGAIDDQNYGRQLRSDVEMGESRVFNNAEPGFNAGKLLLLAAPIAQEALRNTDFFRGLNLDPAGLGFTCGDIQSLDATDRYTVSLLRLLDAILTDNLKWVKKSKAAYLRLNQDGNATSVLPEETIAAKIESDRDYDRDRRPIFLSPILLNGFKNMRLVELYCLALAEGLIKKSVDEKMVLAFPGDNESELVISRQINPHVDLAVDGLITWVDDAEKFDDWISRLEEHYTENAAVDRDSLIEWANLGEDMRTPWTAPVPENESLQKLISYVAGHFLRTNHRRWQDD